MSQEPVTDVTRPGRTLAARIDQACDRFETALRAGEPAKIEEHLAGFEGPFRGSLFHELLVLEVGYRRGRGEKVDRDEYCRRFPERADIVDRVLGVAVTEPLGESSQSETIVSTSRFSKLRFHDSGGLGEVFKAEDVMLKRDVALKFIQPRHGSDPNCLDLFLTEAEITSRLDHPGVVPVYGLGESWDGRPFYAMRLVQGTRLREEIERFHRDGCARLDLHRLLSHLVSVCNTVAYAHNRGIVHRDIKPENIMLGRFQETTLLDWGLAIPVQRDERARASGEKTMLVGKKSEEKSSITGAGTLGYMSPEQLPESTLPIGPASDVYSLGATLYKLLTGKTAFQSKHPNVWEEIREGRFPRPREVKADVPPALEAICLKAMANDPEDRYTSALDLAKDLQAWLADEPVSVYREAWLERWGRWGRQHRTWLLFGLVSAAMLISAATLAAVYQRYAAIRAAAAEDTSTRIAAQFGAKMIATGIDLRWRILSEHAADHELHEFLIELAKPEPDPMAQQRLQTWLIERRDAEPTRSESWFIDDAQGIQVARSPRADSIGNSFRDRDYFHGRGHLTPEEAATAKPIEHVHRSMVYESSNDHSLRVAFTVPIRKDNDPASEPVGVLGMSIELGKFAALETNLGSGLSAVLVDLREDWLEGREGTGLILHHPELQASRQRRTDKNTAVFRIEPKRVEELRNLSVDQQQLVDPQYRDPVTGRIAKAVFEPVLVDSRPDDRDTGWVVIIQQTSMATKAER